MILALLLGWQFTVAEFVGGPIMIVLLALLFRLFLRERLVAKAREQADKGIAGSMEGHAAMDMSLNGRKLLSRDGFTAVAHVFVMEWAAILRDLVIGLLIAGAVAAWVPDSFWQGFFLADHPVLSAIWGPIVGPVVAVLSFVCSIGNVPLAAVLWTGGISFGGVVAFVFADLMIVPILTIYRKYYGTRMALFVLGTFFAATVGAGYLVELLFGVTGLTPTDRSARVVEAGISWNYTTWLNIVFLVIGLVLVVRFFRTGGRDMLKMMGGAPDAGGHTDHHHMG
ncbi:permease [Kutzneria kofuensis]|uniref:permease n=1 Tax=Kutzneria kofuensis TaxID=103725 RepID=UPI0031E619B9